MFDDLPPPQSTAKTTSDEDEEDSCKDSKKASMLSWTDFAKQESVSTSLKFKPRLVATGVKEVISSASGPPASKTRRKEIITTATPITDNIESSIPLNTTEFELCQIVFPPIPQAPEGIILDPNAYVHVFETADPYNPAFPNDYQSMLVDAHLERLNGEENARRLQSNDVLNKARDDAVSRNDLDGIRSTVVRTRRNINNLPAWMTVQNEDEKVENANKVDTNNNTSEISSSADIFQALDYSTLSLTLCVLEVNDQPQELLDYLASFGCFKVKLYSLHSNDKPELHFIFTNQSSCIRSYYSLSRGRARDICLKTNKNPPRVHFFIE